MKSLFLASKSIKTQFNAASKAEQKSSGTLNANLRSKLEIIPATDVGTYLQIIRDKNFSNTSTPLRFDSNILCELEFGLYAKKRWTSSLSARYLQETRRMQNEVVKKFPRATTALLRSL